MKKLIVIDAFSLIYKSFYAVREMHASDSTPTNAIYGFVNMILKLIKDENPDYIFTAFDSGPTFRHESYKEYKAGRQAMPEELQKQIPIIKELLQKSGIAVLSCEGYEADDIVGKVSVKASADGMQVLIVTGDRDSFQLSAQDVTVIYARKGVSDIVRVTPEYINETYGINPKQLISVKALMGDASDNIPGVMGIGEKTALSLIKDYASLDAVYENIEKIKGKLKEKLINGKESAYLSYDLARIRTEFAFDFDYSVGDDFNFASAESVELFERLEMKNILRLLNVESDAKKTNEADELLSFDSVASLPELSFFKGKEVVALVEAHSDDEMFLCVSNGKTVYSGYANKAYINSFYTESDIKVVSHDFKEQYKTLVHFGVTATNFSFDTFIAAYLLNATDERYDINTLTKKYLGISLPEKKVVKQPSFFEEEKNADADMLSQKAAAVFRLKDVLKEGLEQENMHKLYYEIEHKLILILAEMEIIGFKADEEELKRLDRDFDAQKGAITQRIRTVTGYDETLNLNSSKQLAWLLYEDLELPAVKKTKGGGGYSTDNEALEKLRDKHEIVPLIIEYRQVAKLSSTYIKGMLSLIEADGRIHSTFNQTITTTGRISSSNPNLQNIPVRTQEGRQIRKVFVPADGEHVLVDADYSQIELRVLAHITGDEGLCAAFERGEDIHTRTAGEVFGVDIADVSPEQRSRAKAVNFGIVYGISDFGLAKNLNIKRGVAKEYIDKYLEKFPKVKEYMVEIVDFCRKNGYVETMFARRRYVPDISSRNFNQRAFAERTALNTPIQGSAADIIKIAMINVSERLKAEKLASKLILQVHDELIIDCLKSELTDVMLLLKEEMENAVALNVPLTAEIKYGESWYETK